MKVYEPAEEVGKADFTAQNAWIVEEKRRKIKKTLKL